MTLFDSWFPEDCMTWSLGPIFRVFASTLHIIAIAIISIFRQASSISLVIFSVFAFSIDSTNPAVFYSRRFSSSVSFVSATVFLYWDISSEMTKTCPSNQAQKLESYQALVTTSYKIEKIRQMAQAGYQVQSVWAPIYTPSALQVGGPRLSLTVAILSKGRCFFGPSA
jgi:hypothetical protein